MRAESQPIVRQAYSQAYNTPLRGKVVYNVSIFPDGRVVFQGLAAQRVRAHAGRGPISTAQEQLPALSVLASYTARLGKVNIVAVQHGF